MRYKVTFLRHGAPDGLAFDTLRDAETFAAWLQASGVDSGPEVADIEEDAPHTQFSGSALTRHRKRRGLTQAQLSAMTGIPLDTLREYGRGKYSPSAERLAALSRSLKVFIDELFEAPDEQP